jgi:hypothetical protein
VKQDRFGQPLVTEKKKRNRQGYVAGIHEDYRQTVAIFLDMGSPFEKESNWRHQTDHQERRSADESEFAEIERPLVKRGEYQTWSKKVEDHVRYGLLIQFPFTVYPSQDEAEKGDDE